MLAESIGTLGVQRELESNGQAILQMMPLRRLGPELLGTSAAMLLAALGFGALAALGSLS